MTSDADLARLLLEFASLSKADQRAILKRLGHPERQRLRHLAKLASRRQKLPAPQSAHGALSPWLALRLREIDAGQVDRIVTDATRRQLETLRARDASSPAFAGGDANLFPFQAQS